MSQLVTNKQKTKSKQSNLQKTFVRLRKKAENLESQLESATEEFNQALVYYHKEIVPVTAEATKALIECVKIFYVYHKGAQGLSKKERKTLKGLICDLLANLARRIPLHEMDPEISKIHRDIVGCGFEERAADEFCEMKSDLKDMFQEEGIDIDLSDIGASDNHEEVLAKVFEAMKEAGASASPEKKKTKRQIEKERKIQELALIQKKGLAMIYKPLAKALHPDLEQDPVAKIEKEVLMKQLTHAYEEGDLHMMLKIQGEWMDRQVEGSAHFNFQSDEQMRIYNSILKDQVAKLEHQLETLILHPKYYYIFSFFPESYVPIKSSRPIIFFMRERLNEEKQQRDLYRHTLRGLRGPNPLKTLRDVLRQWEDEDMSDLDADLMAFLDSIGVRF